MAKRSTQKDQPIEHQPKELDQQFVSLLFHARTRIRFAMDDRFKPMGITDATWRTLFFLRQEDGVSQKHLAKTMAIEGPSLVRLLDSLSDKGLVERRNDPADRRVNNIYLTEKAGGLLEELDLVSRAVRSDLLADISEQELNTCIRVLTKILEVPDHE
jgi:MarR family transcriptional regulator for hemolysin